jgi:hypothetical protein
MDEEILKLIKDADLDGLQKVIDTLSDTTLDAGGMGVLIFTQSETLRKKVSELIVNDRDSKITAKICQLFFHWFKSVDVDTLRCALSYLPYIIYSYIISVSTMSPTIGLEACLTSLYAREVQVGVTPADAITTDNNTVNQFRPPSLDVSSSYHTPSKSINTNQEITGLTISSLNNHNSSLGVVYKPRELSPINPDIDSSTRDMILGVCLRRFSKEISKLGDEMVYTSFCNAFIAILSSDSDLCKRSTSDSIFDIPSKHIHISAQVLIEVLPVFSFFKVSNETTVPVNVKKLARSCLELIHIRALELLDPILIFGSCTKLFSS